MKPTRPYHPNTAEPGRMLVRLIDIRPEGLDLQEPLKAAWFDAALGKESPYRAAEDGKLSVQVHKVEEVVHVRGRASVRLGAPCSRCLEPVSLDLDAPLEIALFPQGAEPPPGIDGELQDEDMGVATYQDEMVDLAALVHDEIFLELPMNPLCGEDCAGLCASCGQNLNQGACKCEKAVDARWQALGRIKLN
jgi:uncharacterized protein